MQTTWKRLALAAALALSTLSGGCAALAGPFQSAGGQPYADYLIGRYAEERNDSATAAQAFERGARQMPANRAFIEAGMLSALRAGDTVRAVEAARRGAAAGFDNPLQRLILASQALAQRRYQEAKSHLVDLTGAPIERLAGAILLAWTEAGLTDGVAALAALDSVKDAMPLAPLTLHQRAMLQDFWGDESSARDSYAKAAGARLPAPLAMDRYARLLERAGEASQAELVYQEALARNRSNPVLQAGLDRLRAGGAPGVIQAPAQGAAAGLYAVAAVLAGQTQPELYLPFLTLALTLDPRLDVGRLLFAEALNSQNQPGAALAMLERVEARGVIGDVALVQTAWALQRMNKADAAIGRLAVSRSDSRLVRETKADLYRVQSRWFEAETAYSELIAGLTPPQPSDWRMFFARGASRERQGKWTGAEADLKEALRLNPDQPDALNYLGYSWVERGVQLDEAVALLDRATRLAPGSGAIADSLGWAYFKLGRYDEAAVKLERAWALDPVDPTINDHLGDLYAKIGRVRDAIVLWRRALTLNPAPRDRALIAAKLTAAGDGAAQAAAAKP
ncbi:MAG: tetratricopeptide repeat protein [Caulobacterales bacterium]